MGWWLNAWKNVEREVAALGEGSHITAPSPFAGEPTWSEDVGEIIEPVERIPVAVERRSDLIVRSKAGDRTTSVANRQCRVVAGQLWLLLPSATERLAVLGAEAEVGSRCATVGPTLSSVGVTLPGATARGLNKTAAARRRCAPL